jgi:hypothetical protein
MRSSTLSSQQLAHEDPIGRYFWALGLYFPYVFFTILRDVIFAMTLMLRARQKKIRIGRGYDKNIFLRLAAGEVPSLPTEFKSTFPLHLAKTHHH